MLSQLSQMKLLPLMFLGIAVITFSLTGCETLDGAGRDIENAGEAVQDAAK